MRLVCSARRNSRLLAPLALLAAALALASCGVPIDSAARVLPQSEIPAPLAHVTPTSVPPANNGCASDTNKCAPVKPWWVLPDGLLQPGAIGYIRQGTSVPDLLQLLDSGPTVDDRANGLETYLPPEARLVFLSISGPKGDTANIDLGNTYTGTEPQVVVLLAQIVFTVTNNFPGITYVQFWLKGTPIPVQTGYGALKTGAVSQCDYTEQLPASTITDLGLNHCVGDKPPPTKPPAGA